MKPHYREQRRNLLLGLTLLVFSALSERNLIGMILSLLFIYDSCFSWFHALSSSFRLTVVVVFVTIVALLLVNDVNVCLLMSDVNVC